GRGLDRSVVDKLNTIATGGLEPDLWILLDLSLEESERRRKLRPEASDRLDSEKAEFHQKVRDYYLRLAKEDPKNWLVLNAEATPEELYQELELSLKERGWLN
ncbi:MAG: dTMP kinase, partial [Pseudomonadota bacterium]